MLQAAWLLRLCGVSAHSPKELDDPNTTIANLLSGLKALGFAPPSYPPIKLAVGYGPEVCGLLDALADLALQTKGWAPQPLLHIQTRWGGAQINRNHYVILCGGDQEPRVVGLGTFDQWHDWSCVLTGKPGKLWVSNGTNHRAIRREPGVSPRGEHGGKFVRYCLSGSLWSLVLRAEQRGHRTNEAHTVRILHEVRVEVP